jgi:uncharacterized SAM-binding protein YcdF (DUF218 family)
MPHTKRILGYALAAGALWFILHSVAITWRGLYDDARPADVIVVPGNKVELTGVPSVWLQDRLDKALDLYRQGLAPRIIVSGGLGREGFCEAEVMRDYLVARGVPAADVIVDNGGYDTYRTAANARGLMAEGGMRSAIVVSQYYHLARARLALARAGIGPVYSAHAGFRLSLRQPYAILREFVAYYYYVLRPS